MEIGKLLYTFSQLPYQDKYKEFNFSDLSIKINLGFRFSNHATMV